VTDRARACLVSSLLSLLGLAVPVAAQPAQVDARVVWVRDERVYIVSSDSLALGYGALLTFLSHGKPVATGEVARVVDGELVVARLTSGSLARIKDPKRLRVLAEPARGPRLLRVGYPSRVRSTLFFACDQLILTPPFPPGAYRVEAGDHLVRLIPTPGEQSRAPWPETLLVRQFDEAADEEIALERGEVEAAVFWPGELSTHMREQPRWKDFLSSARRRGCVAALWMGPPSDSANAEGLPGGSLLTSLNQELFRGDLDELWHGRESASDTPPRITAPHGVRFEVDPACPGWPVLERFLARAQGPPPAPDDRAVVRLVYLDSPLGPPDSIATAAAQYGRSGPSPPQPRTQRAELVFAFDCPVLFDSRLRPYVRALGAKALVELFDCVPTGRRP
jgi:hypothetical protein